MKKIAADTTSTAPQNHDPVLAVVLGPTGSGKTALSMTLAEALGGEIVSCDSVAVYREFEIGAAKPAPTERLRIPHHMLDVVTASESFTAGDYSRQARQALTEIHSRGKMPIVAGGTGLYLRALLLGLSPAPGRLPHLRERLRCLNRKHGAEYLHRILRKLDSPSAQGIHANDVPKIIRAIEVRLASRHTMSTLWGQGRDPLTGFRVVRLGLAPDRDALYARINRRAEQMFDDGLVEETRLLLQKYGAKEENQTSSLPFVFRSLGYKQALAFLRGDLILPDAVAAAQQAHRNYAKRQMTWFRREPDVRWFTGFGDNQEVQSEAVAAVRSAQSQE